ncbi:hypothetical protein M405DRAFT_506665 [Rhizopogon salebrosus TDB-379]|nr:hypothetical protein M405DRAFT_506665 [Rhizopogon salebrosus TDB-379]
MHIYNTQDQPCTLLIHHSSFLTTHDSRLTTHGSRPTTHDSRLMTHLLTWNQWTCPRPSVNRGSQWNQQNALNGGNQLSASPPGTPHPCTVELHFQTSLAPLQIPVPARFTRQSTRYWLNLARNTHIAYVQKSPYLRQMAHLKTASRNGVTGGGPYAPHQGICASGDSAGTGDP